VDQAKEDEEEGSRRRWEKAGEEVVEVSGVGASRRDLRLPRTQTETREEREGETRSRKHPSSEVSSLCLEETSSS